MTETPFRQAFLLLLVAATFRSALTEPRGAAANHRFRPPA